MTEPAELARLVGMSETQSRFDWARAAAAIGAPVPSDYVELLDAYGPGIIDNDIVVFQPGGPDGEYDLLDEGLQRWVDIQEFYQDPLPDYPMPARLQAPGTKLIAWAGTGEAEYLYWVANPSQPPRAWTVAVEQGEDHRWEFHDMGCVDFLYGLLTGEVHSEILTGFADRTRHSYTRYGD